MGDAYERMRAKLETEASEWKARFEAEAEEHSSTRRVLEDAKRREAEARAEVVRWRGQYECAATECEGALGALSDCRRREAERTARIRELENECARIDAIAIRDRVSANERIAAARAEGAKAMRDHIAKACAADAKAKRDAADNVAAGDYLNVVQRRGGAHDLEAFASRVAALSPATVVAALAGSPAPPPEAIEEVTPDVVSRADYDSVERLLDETRRELDRERRVYQRRLDEAARDLAAARSAAPAAPPSPPRYGMTVDFAHEARFIVTHIIGSNFVDESDVAEVERRLRCVYADGKRAARLAAPTQPAPLASGFVGPAEASQPAPWEERRAAIEAVVGPLDAAEPPAPPLSPDVLARIEAPDDFDDDDLQCGPIEGNEICALKPNHRGPHKVNRWVDVVRRAGEEGGNE